MLADTAKTAIRQARVYALPCTLAGRPRLRGRGKRGHAHKLQVFPPPRPLAHFLLNLPIVSATLFHLNTREQDLQTIYSKGNYPHQSSDIVLLWTTHIKFVRRSQIRSIRMFSENVFMGTANI